MYSKRGLTEFVAFRAMKSQVKELDEFAALYKQTRAVILREALSIWLNKQTEKNTNLEAIQEVEAG